MSTEPSVVPTSVPGTLQLPTIQITPDEDVTETRSANGSITGHNERHPSTRSNSQGRARTHGLFDLVTAKGILSTVPHFIIGITLIATGCVVQSLLDSKAMLTQPPSSPQRSKTITNISTSLLPTPYQFHIDDLGALANPDGLRQHSDPCEALGCSTRLPLVYIAAGCVLILCGMSGGLMLAYKMKEYVSCHLLWLSVTTLCSATLIAACAIGLKNTYKHAKKGIPESVCVAVICTSVEMLFCVVDLYCLKDYFSAMQGRPNAWEVESVAPILHVEAPSIVADAAELRQDANNATSAPTARNRRSPTLAINPARRNIAGHGYHGRRRRSGQAGTRDRNSLHPGYHHQGQRNRIRRRPILRAQNHYVLVPAAYARQSRAVRNQTQQQRVDMPMFVIANHDRYVQALNQSMEHLERDTNRGSVPDILPGSLLPGNEDLQASNRPPSRRRNVLEKSDSQETTLSSSSLDSSKIIRPSQGNVDRIEQLTPAVTTYPAEDVVQFRRTRDAAGYSVVMRTKDGMKIKSKKKLEAARSHDAVVDGKSTACTLQPNDNSRRAVSVAEDSVFQQSMWGQSGSSACVTDAEPYYTRVSSKNTRERFYNAASEGDFSNLASSSTTDPAHERKSHTSVSSDSGIVESSGGASSKIVCEMQRSYYRNEMSGSNSQFSLSPVSAHTPSYENLNARAGIGSRENFIFTSQDENAK